MSRLRVAILYGGTSEEHEVSVLSARSVIEAIDREKYDVVPVAITKKGQWLLPERAPDRLTGQLPAVEDAGTAISLRPESGVVAIGDGPVDVVFPVLHGPGGEDGTVQGMLDVLGIPYVGSGVAASAVGMDKSLQKPIFSAAGIPVTPWLAVRATDFIEKVARAAVDELGLPLFTKPANLGSSVGVSKCRTQSEVLDGLHEAFRHDRVALVEQAIDGRELECAVLGNHEPEASVVGEIVPANEFYDYDAKYVLEGSETIVPADIPDDVAQLVRTYAARAFTSIGCAGMARVDFFYSSSGDVVLNEINTIPGFTPISMYPKLWEATGIPYAKLIDRLIELALERHAR